MEKIEIRFDDQDIFYSGQIVNGYVHIALENPTPVRAITLRVSGVTEVRWEELVHRTRTDNRRNHGSHPHQHGSDLKIYTSRELYFEYKIALLAASSSDPVLQKGEHKYPFSFNLPHNIPSSFEGRYGNVRYIAICHLDKPCARDHESKLMFTVICPLDLNRFPHLAIQADASEVRTFWCLFCRSGPITVILRLPESGIVSGQFITPTVDVDNGSDVRINQVKLLLVMKVNYSAMGTYKKEEKIVSEVYLGSVEPKKLRTWFRGIFLQVPALPPSGLNNCTLIDLSYKLKVIAEPKRPHLNITVALPLTVATIPFKANFTLFSAAASAPPLGWNNPAPTAPVAQQEQSDTSSATYSSLPPPSYEESIGYGRVQAAPDDYLELLSPTGFVPRYPVYSSLPLPPEMVQDINN